MCEPTRKDLCSEPHSVFYTLLVLRIVLIHLFSASCPGVAAAYLGVGDGENEVAMKLEYSAVAFLVGVVAGAVVVLLAIRPEWTQTTTALVGFEGAILGGVLSGVGNHYGSVQSWKLNEKSTQTRERQREDKQIEAVRTLLRVELEQNKATLEQFWQQIHAELPLEGPEQQLRRLAKRFRSLSLSTSSRLWESQLPLVPMALKKNEIERVLLIHAILDEIRQLRCVEVNDGNMGQIWNRWQSYYNSFRDEAKKFLDDFQTVTTSEDE